MNKGVFCCNCTYYKSDGFYHFPIFKCKVPTGKIIVDYVNGNRKEVIDLYPNDVNYPNDRETNGCKLYKRKWWKFWV